MGNVSVLVRVVIGMLLEELDEAVGAIEVDFEVVTGEAGVLLVTTLEYELLTPVPGDEDVEETEIVSVLVTIIVEMVLKIVDDEIDPVTADPGLLLVDECDVLPEPLPPMLSRGTEK